MAKLTNLEPNEKPNYRGRGIADSVRDREPPPRTIDSNLGRRGLYDSVDVAPAAEISKPLRKPAASFLNDNAALDPTGDGRGGMAGLRDPYDRPTRSQLMGAQSRLRQDKASGALQDVAGRYRVLFGGHHIVRKGLRRSIADAYAAYVGQVVNLPQDTYGLALRALDHTFNTGRQPPGAIDLHLHASPFATSPAKRAQIFNTAHKIMRDLGGYVYDVSYYCPGELDQLRQMRRPQSAPGRQGYRAGPLLPPGEPPANREAVAVAPRATPNRPGARRALDGPPNPAVNPITGAVRPAGGFGAAPGPVGFAAAEPSGRRQTGRRPQSAAPAEAASAAGVVGAARSVAAALDASAAAAAAERAGGGGGRPGALSPAEQQQERDLRRLSSPGTFVKTPPHYKVSRYYDHVSPTEEVVQFMRQRALEAAAARRQMGAAGGDRAMGPAPFDRAAVVRPTTTATAAAESGIDGVEEATFARMQEVLAVGSDPVTRRSPPPQQAAPPANRRQVPPGPTPHGGVQGNEPYNSTERILWIIETAYELGLAEVLGLEGPPPYARSRRLWPLPHRRQFYDGVYSSPERYMPYTREEVTDNMPYHPPYYYRDLGQRAGPLRYASPPPGYLGPVQPYAHDGETAHRLHVADAQRYVRQAQLDDKKVYGRSRRVLPSGGRAH